MYSTLATRSALCLALAATLAPFLLGPFSFTTFGSVLTRESGVTEKHFAGKVSPLAAILDKAGIKLDADAAGTWYALVADDGKVYPLIKDDGARMFFKDARLLDRPMRLTGRLQANSQMLQVLQVHSVIDSVVHEVYYWCDICTIKRYEKKICDCCGAPMELRETPIK